MPPEGLEIISNHTILKREKYYKKFLSDYMVYITILALLFLSVRPHCMVAGPRLLRQVFPNQDNRGEERELQTKKKQNGYGTIGGDADNALVPLLFSPIANSYNSERLAQ